MAPGMGLPEVPCPLRTVPPSWRAVTALTPTRAPGARPLDFPAAPRLDDSISHAQPPKSRNVHWKHLSGSKAYAPTIVLFASL